MSARDIVHVSQSALHLVELLEIGKAANGEVDTREQYKSRYQRWFLTNKKHELMVGLDENGKTGEPVNVDRDTLVGFKCKCGGRDTREQYLVVGIFCKYYNKFFFYLQ